MEDQQRKRLIILGVAGVLFAGGMGAWMWNNSAKEAADEQVMVHMPTTQHPAVATTAPLTGATTPISNIRPAAGLPAATTLPNASTPGNPPLGATPAIKPAVAITPAVPGVTPATALPPAVSLTAAVKPVVPATVATAKTQSELDSFNAAKTNAASKTLVAAKIVQPVVPVVTPAVTKAAPAVVAAKAPAKAAAKAPSLPNGAALPNLLSKIIPGAVGNAPAPAAATVPAGDGIVAAPALKTIKDGIPATAGFDAATAARKEIGRVDPMQPLMTFLPFPRSGRSAPAATGGDDALVPPPPPGDEAEPTKKTVGVGVTQIVRKGIQKAGADNLVPPPPPSAEPLSGSGNSIAGMPIDQLPVPPSKPTIGDKMKVLAVMDDKAIICFPKAMAIRNKWPRTLTLATGQEFESVKIVGVSKDGVTIEEDNERTLKPISTVK